MLQPLRRLYKKLALYVLFWVLFNDPHVYGESTTPMEQSRDGLALGELLRLCLRHNLIDGYEERPDVVTITRYKIVHFRLQPEQARTFLHELLRQRPEFHE